jgi:hypothetical protein
MKLASIHSQKCTLCGHTTTWGAWNYKEQEREPLCLGCIDEWKSLGGLEFDSRSDESEFYKECKMEGEKQYLVSKCNGDHAHFFIKAFDGDKQVGATVDLFDEALAHKINDLDQQNFSKDVGGGE